jgi:multidrug resistance efflux pump
LLVLAGLGAGGAWIASHWGVEETDNAQLQAHLIEISSRVPGTISAVAVQDNEPVRAGQLLVALDPRDAQAALRLAQADWVEARSQAQAMAAQASATASGKASQTWVACLASKTIKHRNAAKCSVSRKADGQVRRTSRGRSAVGGIRLRVSNCSSIASP